MNLCTGYAQAAAGTNIEEIHCTTWYLVSANGQLRLTKHRALGKVVTPERLACLLLMSQRLGSEGPLPKANWEQPMRKLSPQEEQRQVVKTDRLRLLTMLRQAVKADRLRLLTPPQWSMTTKSDWMRLSLLV